MGVRSATCLDVRYISRSADVRDVEDANSTQAFVADCPSYTLRPAVETSAETFARHEQQVLVDRHVALRCGAEVRIREHWPAWIGDIPDLVAVVVALYCVRACERKIAVRCANKSFRWPGSREQAEVPRGCACVVESALEP